MLNVETSLKIKYFPKKTVSELLNMMLKMYFDFDFLSFLGIQLTTIDKSLLV